MKGVSRGMLWSELSLGAGNNGVGAQAQRHGGGRAVSKDVGVLFMEFH